MFVILSESEMDVTSLNRKEINMQGSYHEEARFKGEPDNC